MSEKREEEKREDEREGGESGEYVELLEGDIVDYVRTLPENVLELLGDLDYLEVKEISDGNVNMVFLLSNTKTPHKMVLKQALPFLRRYRDWPLALSRANFEVQVLRMEKKVAPEQVPTVYYFDEDKRAILMEYLDNHAVLRWEMIKKVQYPHCGEHLGNFLAKTLFSTSDFHLSSREKKKLLQNFSGNFEMCELTEQVFFIFPYRDDATNSCSPQCEEIAAALRSDIQVRVRVSELLRSFISSTEAVLHGDLHSGSVMVTPTSSVCIDPEFGYVGPMAFDIGSLLGNYFLSFFSHMQGKFSQTPNEKERKEEIVFQKYLLSQMSIIWGTFKRTFLELWGREAKGGGEEGEGVKKNSLGSDFFCLEGELELAQGTFFKRLEKDVLGYAGTEMVRRLIGVCHVEDFKEIKDEQAKGKCELMGVTFARELLRGEIEGVEGAVERARVVGEIE